MKGLLGLLYKLKYQTKEFIPNSLHSCTDEQRDIILHSLSEINVAINDLDFYIHNRLALVLETEPIITQIEVLRQKLIEDGMNPQQVDMNETDFNRIINLFTQQLEQPHNTEYFLQILHYTINLWIHEQNVQRDSLATS